MAQKSISVVNIDKQKKVFAVASGTDLIHVGFLTQASLTRRYTNGETIVRTTSKTLPKQFNVEDYKLSGSVLTLKATEDRYKYNMSAVLSSPGYGFFPDTPRLLADGSATVTLVIQKQKSDGTNMTANSGDNDVVNIRTEVGSLSGNALQATLSGGRADITITAPTFMQFGRVLVEDSVSVDRKGQFDIQAS